MLTINGQRVIRNYEPSSNGVSFLDLQYAPADWARKECTTNDSTFPFNIDYDGETIIIAKETPSDPESSTVMTPEVTDVYQP